MCGVPAIATPESMPVPDKEERGMVRRSRSFVALNMIGMPKDVSFRRPERPAMQPVSLDDGATRVMTDLDRVAALTTYPHASLHEAEQRMISGGVRLLLVTDAEEQVVGVITATDILGEKPVQFLQKYGGRREELRVADVMTPHAELQALRLHDVEYGRVGDVVATLRQAGRQHALVVDDSGESPRIRGIISSTQIARQLGRPVEGDGRAHSFAELEAALVAAPA